MFLAWHSPPQGLFSRNGSVNGSVCEPVEVVSVYVGVARMRGGRLCWKGDGDGYISEWSFSSDQRRRRTNNYHTRLTFSPSHPPDTPSPPHTTSTSHNALPPQNPPPSSADSHLDPRRPRQHLRPILQRRRLHGELRHQRRRQQPRLPEANRPPVSKIPRRQCRRREYGRFPGRNLRLSELL